VNDGDDIRLDIRRDAAHVAGLRVDEQDFLHHRARDQDERIAERERCRAQKLDAHRPPLDTGREVDRADDVASLRAVVVRVDVREQQIAVRPHAKRPVPVPRVGKRALPDETAGRELVYRERRLQVAAGAVDGGDVKRERDVIAADRRRALVARQAVEEPRQARGPQGTAGLAVDALEPGESRAGRVTP
jgi:hypothetical protein